VYELFSKRGQTATEYMIVLAIVLVIALIVAAILGGLPSIGGRSRTRSSEAYWQSAEIGVLSWSIENDGAADNAYLEIINNLNQVITIDAIYFDDITITTTDTVLGPGEIKEFTDNDIGDVCDAREFYSLYLNITYIQSKSGDTYKFNGAGHKLEGTCAE